MPPKKKQTPIRKKMSTVEDLRRRVIQAEANLGMAKHGEGLSMTQRSSTRGRVEGSQRAAILKRRTERVVKLKKELKDARTQEVRSRQKPKHT